MSRCCPTRSTYGGREFADTDEVRQRHRFGSSNKPCRHSVRVVRGHTFVFVHRGLELAVSGQQLT
jgi:hypothetical protein